MAEPLLHTYRNAALLNKVSLGTQVGKKQLTFSNNAASSTIDLFKVTGIVKVKVLAICRTTCDGTSTTISVGTSGASEVILPNTDPDTIAAGDIWVDATATEVEAVAFSTIPDVIVNKTNIILTVGSGVVASGGIDFYAFYETLEDNASVTVA